MPGVKMPTLTWTNEIMPIRQGTPVVITLFGGMGYTVLLFAGFLLLPGWMFGFIGYMACFIGETRFGAYAITCGSEEQEQHDSQGCNIYQDCFEREL